MPKRNVYVSDRSSQILDAVAAYDRLAPIYPQIATARKPYLESIGNLIVARVPSGSQSLLDVGAGNGARALRIAKASNLDEVVLLEPSREMVKSCPAATEVWAIRAEELSSDEFAGRCFAPERRFDIIMCLWNVLGHIAPHANRVQVLRQLGSMLSPQGILFVDVNHRYNIQSYGLGKTISRFLYDQLWPGERNGDVTPTWDIDDVKCSTYGHVFTQKEIRKLAAAAHLRIEERLVIDYDTGVLRRFGFQGNLLYAFRQLSE
ncbi:MAG TPA: class I SAM-dependent methyltransferase [Terriglobales bacterium]|nr:class I SAM-dependent methyltransferase [Terriglobales bacterium]